MKRVSIKKIAFLYVLYVCIYGVIASFFTSTLHIDADEEIYLALARSFHYEGHFIYGGELTNYSCILYSMLISIAYFFYSPEHLLLFMRFIGVIVMTSSIFPIWFIAKKMLASEGLAFKTTIFCMFLPFMFDSAYIMQEVLAYPLFLWMLWFYLCAVEKENGWYYFLCALFSVFCFFTKTYLFFIPIIFNIVAGLALLRYRQENQCVQKIKKIIVYDITYVISFIALYLVPLIINNFEKGNNHYSSQFSHLFPISVTTIICGVSCYIFYISFLVVNTGIIPSIALLWKRKNTSGYERKFWDFIFLSITFLIFEIVIMIVLTEEGNVMIPHKFLFRYFQIFSVPLIIGFLSAEHEMHISKWECTCVGAACGITIFYWIIMYQKTRLGIIDGHFFVLLGNINRIIPYGGAIVASVFSLLVLGLMRKKKQWCKYLAVSIVVCFWGLNCVQLPYYTNVIADGAVIEEDAVKLAEYLNTSDITHIYYIKQEATYPYLQNCYGYFIQPFQVIDAERIEEYMQPGEKAFIIATKANTENIFNDSYLKKINLKTEVLSIYVKESR